MAKNQGDSKLFPLPFTTFGEAVALGFEASVYCPRCYEQRSIAAATNISATAVLRGPDFAAPRSDTQAMSAAARDW
jgi:hypothetical protein